MTEKRNKDRNVPTLRFPGFDDEWKKIRIGELLVIGSGKDYKHLQTGNVPVFGTGGYMTSVNKCLHDGETVCIGRKGTINKPFYYNGKIWTVDTLFYTHSFKNLIPRFCFNLFEKINWLQFNEASGVPSLSKTTIENIEVNIPEESEQKKIASFLIKIEERIETQNKIIENLESLIKSICQKLIYSKTPNIQLNNCVRCYSSNLTEADAIMQFGNYPIYGATGIIAYSENYQINTNAILIIKDGASIGRVQFTREKASVIGTLNYLLANENVSLEYIFYCLKYFNFSKFKVGSGIPHIYFRDYGEAMIYCPSYNEQVKVSTLLVSLEEKLLIEMKILKKLQVQKQYLLAYLFI